MGGCACVAQEHLGLGRTKLAVPRDLYGHSPVELCVERFEYASELTDSDMVQQLEVSNRLSDAAILCLLDTAHQTETAAARWATDFFQRRVFQKLNRIVAMRAADVKYMGRCLAERADQSFHTLVLLKELLQLDGEVWMAV